MKKYGIYLLILVVCMAIGLKTAIETPLGRNTVVFEVTNSHAGMTELFYDVGTGFSAEKRVPVELTEVEQKTVIEYEVPLEQIRQLRWDPVYHEEGVQTVIHSAKMSYYGGENVLDIEFESVVPKNHIKTFEIEEKTIKFAVESGFNDPYLVFTKIPEAPEAPSRTWVIVKGILFSLLAAALFSAFYRLIVWYFNS